MCFMPAHTMVGPSCKLTGVHSWLAHATHAERGLKKATASTHVCSDDSLCNVQTDVCAVCRTEHVRTYLRQIVVLLAKRHCFRQERDSIDVSSALQAITVVSIHAVCGHHAMMGRVGLPPALRSYHLCPRASRPVKPLKPHWFANVLIHLSKAVAFAHGYSRSGTDRSCATL